MARITLGFDVFSARIMKAERRAIAFPAARFHSASHRHRQLMILGLLLLMHLLSMNTRAQGTIVAMEKNRRPVGTPTNEVTRIGHSARRAEPINSVPTNLGAGDQLIGNSGAVTVKVRCNTATDVPLYGRFNVRFLPATARGCNLFFKRDGNGAAGMNVDASGPTSIQAGAVRMASAHTRYEFRWAEKGRGFFGALKEALPEVYVYQGKVEILSPFFSGEVKEGYKLVSAGGDRPSLQKVTLEDILRAANVYARVDVVQIPGDEGRTDAVFNRFIDLYQAVLANPHDETKLMALREAQAAAGIPSSQSNSSQQQTAANTLELNRPLKPGEKEVFVFNFAGQCKMPMSMRLMLNNLSFVRLLSPADSIAKPGEKGEWQLEFDATGLKSGSYQGEAELICLNCSNSNCVMQPKLLQVKLNVQ